MEKPATIERTRAGNGRLIGRVVRPLVSIALLAFLLQTADVSAALSLALNADLFGLAVGAGIVVVALVVSAYKWQQLLVAQGVPVPLGKLFSSYLVGLFFNNFLPTNIGGDVVRIHDVARYTGRTAEAAASVIVERLLAGLALGLTAALGLLASYQVSGGFSGVVIAVLAISGGITALFASRWARRAVGRWVKLPNAFGIRRRLSLLADSLHTSLRDWRIVAWVLVLSMAFHALVVLLAHVIFLALGAQVPLVYSLLFIPIISAIQMLPISVSGFGVREGFYAYFFGWVGLSATQAVTASLMFWALVAAVSLAGGVIFALRR